MTCRQYGQRGREAMRPMAIRGKDRAGQAQLRARPEAGFQCGEIQGGAVKEGCLEVGALELEVERSWR